jgi:glucose-6-phosphate isomerase, archaeal
MANIVSTWFESDYSTYEQFHGAAYFELEGGELVRNPRYPPPSAFRILTARDQVGISLLPARPLYELIGTEFLGFLNRPGEYPELFL